MAGRVLILGGGAIDYGFAAGYLKDQEFDSVACADSGLDAAKRLGIRTDFLLGDFDSVDKETLDSFMEETSGNSTKFARYPAEKDYTDMHLVLGWVVERKPSEIVILGATGGRLDHLVANINILMLPLKNNIPAYIVDKNNKLCLVNSRYNIAREDAFGKYISVYPLTEEVSGLSLSGVKYPLDGITLKKGGSMTVSNEFAEGAREVVISLDKGILIVIQSSD